MVRLAGSDSTRLPGGNATLATREAVEMKAFHNDPAHAQMYNEETYHLVERGYDIEIRSTGTIRTTETDFHADVQLQVTLNGNSFFEKAWLETIPRRLM